MKTIRHKVHGVLFPQDGKNVVLLEIDSAEAPFLYLRYALTMRGTERLFFPTCLLDDWGTEIKGLALYEWLHEHGDRFPRGDIFGFEKNGNDIQRFVREVELGYKMPCYAYLDPTSPLDTGILVDVMAIHSAESLAIEQIKPPKTVALALRRARVEWWQVPPDFQG